jgi:hypothetical protein
VRVPGFKLVAKRGTRQWVDEKEAIHWLDGKGIEEPYTRKVISPAQAEKALKSRKIALPEDMTVSISSGSTLAAESDPRPAVINLGKQLANLKLI